jgi:hypothetical protein
MIAHAARQPGHWPPRAGESESTIQCVNKCNTVRAAKCRGRMAARAPHSPLESWTHAPGWAVLQLETGDPAIEMRLDLFVPAQIWNNYCGH